MTYTKPITSRKAVFQYVERGEAMHPITQCTKMNERSSFAFSEVRKNLFLVCSTWVHLKQRDRMLDKLVSTIEIGDIKPIVESVEGKSLLQPLHNKIKNFEGIRYQIVSLRIDIVPPNASDAVAGRTPKPPKN